MAGKIATRKIEIADLVFQKCLECGADNAPHPHRNESCISCQCSDHYNSINHWQAAIWDELPEEEHELTRDWMVRDYSLLCDLRAQLQRLGKWVAP